MQYREGGYILKLKIPRKLQKETPSKRRDIVMEVQEICKKCRFECKGTLIAKDHRDRIKEYPRLVRRPGGRPRVCKVCV